MSRAVEAMGIEGILNADTAEIAGTSRVEGVTLKDGRTIEADAVVVAIGIRPSADLARDAGIAVKRGIVIDAWAKISLVGIELLAIEARVVIASVETYLTYAEAIGLTSSAAVPATA